MRESVRRYVPSDGIGAVINNEMTNARGTKRNGSRKKARVGRVHGVKKYFSVRSARRRFDAQSVAWVQSACVQREE